VRIDLRKSDIVRAVNVKGLVDIKGHGSDIDLQNIEGQVTVTGAYSGEIQFRNLSNAALQRRADGHRHRETAGRAEVGWAIDGVEPDWSGAYFGAGAGCYHQRFHEFAGGDDRSRGYYAAPGELAAPRRSTRRRACRATSRWRFHRRRSSI